MPAFLLRLLSQIVPFLERFAFGKWLIWAFDMAFAGTTWLFRGFGQMLMALVLLVGGQHAVNSLPSISKQKTISSVYAISISQAEAVALGGIMAKETSPAVEYLPNEPKPVVWMVFGRKFWVIKDRSIDENTHVDKKGNPLKRFCYRLWVIPVEESEGQYKAPKQFWSDGNGRGGSPTWPEVAEECRLEGNSKLRFWWG